MSQATPALQFLAQARATLTESVERAEAAHATNNTLLVRLAEARAKSSEAVRDAKDKKIDEATAALRMSIAEADAKEIQAMLDQSTLVLASLNTAVSHAQAHAQEADGAARREEKLMVATELSGHILNLEATLTEAVCERHKAYLEADLNAAATELNKRIQALEKSLLEAVAERHRIQVEMNPRTGPSARVAINVFDFYKPSAALQDVIRYGTKPRI